MTEDLELLRYYAEEIRKDLLDLYPPVWSEHVVDLMWLENDQFRFFDEEFSGACAVSSYMLWVAARKSGIPLNLVGCEYHYWCELGSTVVDVTYSQFDQEIPIYIGPKREAHSDGFIVNDMVREDLEPWPKSQNPFSTYHKEKIEKWVQTRA